MRFMRGAEIRIQLSLVGIVVIASSAIGFSYLITITSCGDIFCITSKMNEEG